MYLPLWLQVCGHVLVIPLVYRSLSPPHVPSGEDREDTHHRGILWRAKLYQYFNPACILTYTVLSILQERGFVRVYPGCRLSDVSVFQLVGYVMVLFGSLIPCGVMRPWENCSHLPLPSGRTIS
eukprot:TRINITY_DN7992_c0_g2_i3.p1 TRINITY_DN7992_c0_g2~~TRINITY_DN7992_c0_g2_i3.p1  ORF type:complete len:124 (+),score=4.75 TRINITY_DN7992_c0_g2_i3:28-399(+)